MEHEDQPSTKRRRIASFTWSPDHQDYLQPRAFTSGNLSRLESLPSEILQYILCYLPVTDNLTLRMVSKRLRSIAIDPGTWEHNAGIPLVITGKTNNVEKLFESIKKIPSDRHPLQLKSLSVIGYNPMNVSVFTLFCQSIGYFLTTLDLHGSLASHILHPPSKYDRRSSSMKLRYTSTDVLNSIISELPKLTRLSISSEGIVLSRVILTPSVQQLVIHSNHVTVLDFLG